MAEQTRLQFVQYSYQWWERDVAVFTGGTMGRGGWGGAWSHCEQTAKCFMPTWFIFTLYATSQWGCVGTLSRHRGGPGLKATRTEGILSKLRKGRLFTHPVHFVSDSLLKIYCFFFLLLFGLFCHIPVLFPPRLRGSEELVILSCNSLPGVSHKPKDSVRLQSRELQIFTQ